jgi:hypothetical protein
VLSVCHGRVLIYQTSSRSTFIDMTTESALKLKDGEQVNGHEVSDHVESVSIRSDFTQGAKLMNRTMAPTSRLQTFVPPIQACKVKVY